MRHRREGVHRGPAERHVAGCALGDPPPADPEAGADRVRVCFELEAVEAQQLRDALAVLRAQLGEAAGELEDGVLLAQMARRVLHEAPADAAPTPPRYTVAVLHCPDCERVRGQEKPLSDTLALEACCDATEVDLRPGPTHGHRRHTLPPAARRSVRQSGLPTGGMRGGPRDSPGKGGGTGFGNSLGDSITLDEAAESVTRGTGRNANLIARKNAQLREMRSKDGERTQKHGAPERGRQNPRDGRADEGLCAQPPWRHEPVC